MPVAVFLSDLAVPIVNGVLRLVLARDRAAGFNSRIFSVVVANNLAVDFVYPTVPIWIGNSVNIPMTGHISSLLGSKHTNRTEDLATCDL